MASSPGLLGDPYGHSNWHTSEMDRRIAEINHQNQLSSLYAKEVGRAAQSPIPIPNPEPNKVLLLLGEDA